MYPAILLAALAADPNLLARDEAEISAAIGEHELKAHVVRLAGQEFLGRGPGDGGDRAAEHLAAVFRKLPLQPAFGSSYFQPIPWLLTTPRADGKTVIGRNVGAFIPGSDPAVANEWIIVSAHFDHLGMRNGVMFPGADDNASGVAMLLEVAEAFALTPKKPRRSIYFISFDLEETGLQGATHFAAHPPREFRKLKTMIVADLIGRSMGGVMEEYVFLLGSETSPELTSLTKTLEPEKGLTVGRLGADLVGTRSDYGPFRDRKAPFLFATTGVHKDYHRPTDVPDRLDYTKLARISRWIEAAARQLADSDEAPRWQPAELGPGLDEVATIRILFERSLARPADVPLSPVQRQRMEAARDRIVEIEKRRSMTAEDRAWLVRTAQWALLNVY